MLRGNVTEIISCAGFGKMVGSEDMTIVSDPGMGGYGNYAFDDEGQAARREYRRVYREHGDSILADDAMWKEALISMELHEGDEACDVARALGRRVPASRYRRCMHELCPEVKAFEGERPCPPYLEKQIPTNGS